MECHRCSVQQRINAGVYSNTPFKRTPCAKCEMTLSHHGVSTCELHEEATPDERPFFSDHDTLTEAGIERLAVVVRFLLQLDHKARQLVMDRIAFPDRPIKVTARRMRIPVSTAHGLLQRAVADAPQLASCIHIRHWRWSKRPAKGDGRCTAQSEKSQGAAVREG